jgi:hypothetical protein
MTDKLYVVEDCEIWIRDAGRYSYKTTKGLDSLSRTLVPNKKWDHLADATRYAIFGGLEQAGPLDVEVEPISFEEAYEKQLRQSLDDDAWGRNQQYNGLDLQEY